MHLVHTYIAYRVSNICSVYRSGLLYVPDRHSYLCVRYAHQSANAVSCRGGVYSYMGVTQYLTMKYDKHLVGSQDGGCPLENHSAVVAVTAVTAVAFSQARSRCH